MSTPRVPLTPQDVVDKMAFTPPRGGATKKNSSKTERQPSFVPDGPPPANAPPTPPPTPPPRDDVLLADDAKNDDVTNLPSYQHENMRRSQEVLRSLGDSTLNPNTGESNWAEGEGTALTEVIWKMRLVNLIACTTTIVLTVFGIVGNIVTLHPAKAVLGIYLIFLASILCCFELHTPVISDKLQDNFGMLYHPLSQSVFLVLLAGLCWGQGGVLQLVLGLVWCSNAIYTTHVYFHYPEYQRMAQEAEQKDLVTWMKRRVSTSKSKYASWAHPDDAVGGFLQREKRHEQERERLVVSK